MASQVTILDNGITLLGRIANSGTTGDSSSITVNHAPYIATPSIYSCSITSGDGTCTVVP